MIIFYSGHVQNGIPNSKVSFIQVLKKKNIGFAFLLLTSPVQLPLDDFSVVIDSLATDALSRVNPEYSFAILLKTQGYLFFIKLISIMCVDSTEPFYPHKSSG